MSDNTNGSYYNGKDNQVSPEIPGLSQFVFDGEAVKVTKPPSKSVTVEEHRWFESLVDTIDGVFKRFNDKIRDLAEDMEAKFKSPSVDKDFVASVVNEEDAQDRVEQHASTEFQEANPYDEEAFELEEEELKRRAKEFDLREKSAAKNIEKNQNHTIVQTKEPKVENAHFPYFNYGFLLTLLFCGIGLMTFTMASFLTQGTRFPFLFDKPYLAGIFSFFPLAMMFLLAEMQSEIEHRKGQQIYFFTMCGLALVFFVGWFLTLVPAQSSSSDSNDLTSAPTFDFSALNIVLQLAGEVALGAALKIRLKLIDQRWRKTVVYQDAVGQAKRADQLEVQAQRITNDKKLGALLRYRKAYEAAAVKHVGCYIQELASAKRRQNERNQAAETAANAARADYYLNKKD